MQVSHRGALTEACCDYARVPAQAAANHLHLHLAVREGLCYCLLVNSFLRARHPQQSPRAFGPGNAAPGNPPGMTGSQKTHCYSQADWW